MKLLELLEKAKLYHHKETVIDHFINKIAVNSKDINKDDVFVAIRGNTNDGHDFIAEVIASGCKTIFYEDTFYRLKSYPNVNMIKVHDTKKALGILSSCFYDHPSQKMDVVGVTGTNGKTTITSLIHHIQELCGVPSTLIGTNGIYFNGTKQDTENTTPSSVKMNEIMDESLKLGIKHAVIEVSSHAVKEQRISQIDFDTMIYTNFSLDHLDYHGTKDDYFYNKALAFAYLGNHYNDKLVLLNGDDPYFKQFYNFIHVQTYSYGLEEHNDFRARNIVCDIERISFDLYYQNRFIDHFSTTQVFGFINVYNLLAALGYFYLKGYDLNKIKACLNKLPKVKGRFEKVETEYPVHAFVDFAHTPKGVYKILQEVKMITKQRIITVIGCGGNRDKIKRPQMANIATTFSDFTIFTSDNPRGEDPEQILNDMLKGVVNDSFISQVDRHKAIEMAINMASEDDIVLILGKGHEVYQLVKGIKYYFNDYEEAYNAIHKRYMEE
jgi:UDP-N-acetylmuramoyl-L-alanyl-D-glutamate--2,6-diaminopimelate ligase